VACIRDASKSCEWRDVSEYEPLSRLARSNSSICSYTIWKLWPSWVLLPHSIRHMACERQSKLTIQKPFQKSVNLRASWYIWDLSKFIGYLPVYNAFIDFIFTCSSSASVVYISFFSILKTTFVLEFIYSLIRDAINITKATY
jgi:hypothetical protein